MKKIIFASAAVSALTMALGLSSPVFAQPNQGGGGGGNNVDSAFSGTVTAFGAAGSFSGVASTGGEKWAESGSGAMRGAQFNVEFGDGGVMVNGMTEGQNYSGSDTYGGFAGAGALEFGGFGGWASINKD